MKEQYALRQADFDALLAIFSSDRDEAGAVYENLRRGLVRYFTLKGCEDSDVLADETLSRVAVKANNFNTSQSSRPSAFVYGFASKIFLEYTRRPRRLEEELVPALHSPVVAMPVETEVEPALAHLDSCLEAFSEVDRTLLLRYYSEEKSEKIALRRKLAEELNCDMEALHMRIHRLRKTLKICMNLQKEQKIS